jgi:1-acyl-sn-glycerol-3-phosphate acyltransferase
MNTGLESPLGEIRGIVQALGSELKWSTDRFATIDAETSLDRDLGLDSLSRLELMGRIERHFGVYLGEQTYTSVETLNDIIRAVSKAQAEQPSLSLPSSGVMSDGRQASNHDDRSAAINAKTLADIIRFHAEVHGARTHMMIHEPGKTDFGMSYSELYASSRRVAAGLRDRGAQKGDAVAIMLPTGRDYFYCFMGAILAGAVPVPIYPPSRPSQMEDHLQRHGAILKNCDARILVTTESMARGLGQILRLKSLHLRTVVSCNDLSKSKSSFEMACDAGDLAFLQYTSGSTGSPKGVMLTHNNLLANIRSMGAAIQATSRDVFVSWLPLYHDMGLIGAWLGSLYFGNLLVVTSPFTFLSQPRRWLDLIQNYGGTLTAAPNFAYELCLRHIPAEVTQKLNLRTLRVMFNGAEAVLPSTVERFLECFAGSGLSRSAFMPVYGLAESSVGLTFPPLGREPRIDVIDREIFLRSGRARSCTVNGTSEMRFVACGQPIPGHEVRVTDLADNELSERQEGYVQFRGPSCTSGYMEQPELNAKLFHESWLESGDLGYMAEGDLFITGRVKDLIKHAGRNLHPEELESLIGGIDGIRRGCVAVFGSIDPTLGSEKLVIVAETRELDPARRTFLQNTINERIGAVLGSAPDEVILTPPHTILKTSSGKIRRSATKQLFDSGALVPKTMSIRWDITKFVLSACLEYMNDRLRTWVSMASSLILWGLAILSSVVIWPLFISWPTISGRWKIAKGLARFVLFFSGIRIVLDRAETLESKQCVYVSNHSSYLDVVILTAVLPYRVSFVAKAELKRVAFFGWTLTRLGCVFVERYDLKQTLEDAKRLGSLVQQGRTLLTFPEGTFTRRQGLLPFHMGAFLMAVGAQVDISPIVMRGTRSILHPDSWIIRPGVVNVKFLPRIAPTSDKMQDNWSRALSLRDFARTEILKYCGEADLAQERDFI